MGVKRTLLKLAVFSLACIVSMQLANASFTDLAIYEKEVLHKPLVKSIEPELGGKMDVQVVAGRYIKESNRTFILLKASDLNLRNEGCDDSPLLLRENREINTMASGY